MSIPKSTTPGYTHIFYYRDMPLRAKNVDDTWYVACVDIKELVPGFNQTIPNDKVIISGNYKLGTMDHSKLKKFLVDNNAFNCSADRDKARSNKGTFNQNSYDVKSYGYEPELDIDRIACSVVLDTTYYTAHVDFRYKFNINGHNLRVGIDSLSRKYFTPTSEVKAITGFLGEVKELPAYRSRYMNQSGPVCCLLEKAIDFIRIKDVVTIVDAIRNYKTVAPNERNKDIRFTLNANLQLAPMNNNDYSMSPKVSRKRPLDRSSTSSYDSGPPAKKAKLSDSMEEVVVETGNIFAIDLNATVNSPPIDEIQQSSSAADVPSKKAPTELVLSKTTPISVSIPPNTTLTNEISPQVVTPHVVTSKKAPTELVPEMISTTLTNEVPPRMTPTMVIKPKKFCVECGQKLCADWKFCGECGQKI